MSVYKKHKFTNKFTMKTILISFALSRTFEKFQEVSFNQ